ncbi:hypothetical protein GFV16_12495 [Bacillus megaterium]|uniref:hypothetical protein n=1 Tax=Priestia TaxID=2800373 RepID=UPI0012932C4D|nr:hypothetical protein [Priestia megaterium]MQR86731.1 hypothetical protein [Priestia megaterium]
MYRKIQEECWDFVASLNSKLEEGSEPRYLAARVINVKNTKSDPYAVTLRFQDEYAESKGWKGESVEIQNVYAYRDFESEVSSEGYGQFSMVVYDDKEHKILMFQLEEEDWYICHVPKGQ